MEFFVFGVVTEYCVRLAAKGLLDRGRRVGVVTDAIEALDPAAGISALDELDQLGAHFVTTSEALRALDEAATHLGQVAAASPDSNFLKMVSYSGPPNCSLSSERVR